MTNYFTLIYLRTNRFSEEKICVGLLANFDGIPYFGYSSDKLSIGLKFVGNQFIKPIKRSFKLLEEDVNKFVRGEEALSLFDMPYSKKILEKLTLKKRGLVQYSDLFELEKSIPFEKLYKKYVGDDWQLSKIKPKVETVNFKKRFFEFVDDKKFQAFDKKYKLTATHFPSLIAPVTVDLIKREKSYVAFNVLDIHATLPTIQRTITRFKSIIELLNTKAAADGLSKGRYYLVYDSGADQKDLIQKIQAQEKMFELIKMSEMKDKI